MIAIFIRKIDNHYYWYRSDRKGGKVVSVYRRKATEKEVELWKKRTL